MPISDDEYRGLIRKIALELTSEYKESRSTFPFDIDAVNQKISDAFGSISLSADNEKRRLEYILHTTVLDIAEQIPTRLELNSAQTNNNLEMLYAVLDIAVTMSDSGVCETTLPFTLLDEVMDTVSVFAAQEIFGYIERRADILRKGMSATGGKGLVMLKMCNSLLRRIPHSLGMSQFAGRVHIFVSNCFPVSERSGVNLRGDFDLSNIAIYHNDEHDSDSGDGKTESTANTNGSDVNMRLYKSFWSLQECFANPHQTVFATDAAGKNNFDNFAASVNQVLDEFRKAENRATFVTMNNKAENSKSMDVDEDNVLIFKYLTSPRLFRLQLGDPQLKSQILFQLLIFCKYVLSMHGTRFKNMKETATNKFIIGYEFQLSDHEWTTISDFQKRAASQLFAQRNDRGLFHRTALFILRHENCWARWKAESCKPFDNVPIADIADEMHFAAMQFLNARRAEYLLNKNSNVDEKDISMGSKYLDKLWNTKFDSDSYIEGLGKTTESVSLADVLSDLEKYCRNDNDFDFLTEREQDSASLLQWRSVRMRVSQDVFSKIDTTSKSLCELRGQVIPNNSTTESPMSVD